MFEFPVNAEDWFDERTEQFAGLGIPLAVIEAVRARTDDPWRDAPGGWTHEWSAAAEQLLANGDPLTASLCFGAARFPCLNTSGRRVAHDRQLDAYLAASRNFNTGFRRLEVDAEYRGAGTPVAIHLFESRRRPKPAAIVLSGGVDTWKMDLHRIAARITRFTGISVAAMDMPGTGESRVPLAPDADRVYAEVVGAVRRMTGAVRIGFLGLSFGGHWAAKLAINGDVDASIDLGGPVGAEAIDEVTLVNLPNGMAGIVSNAVGLEAIPESAEINAMLARFSLREQGLLDGPSHSPLLAVNGADDQYIPPADTLVFAGMPNAGAWLVKDATHCAAECAQPVMTAAVAWLAAELLPGSWSRIRARLARRVLLPPLAGAPTRPAGQSRSAPGSVRPAATAARQRGEA